MSGDSGGMFGVGSCGGRFNVKTHFLFFYFILFYFLFYFIFLFFSCGKFNGFGGKSLTNTGGTIGGKRDKTKSDKQLEF